MFVRKNSYDFSPTRSSEIRYERYLLTASDGKYVDIFCGTGNT